MHFLLYISQLRIFQFRFDGVGFESLFPILFGRISSLILDVDLESDHYSQRSHWKWSLRSVLSNRVGCRPNSLPFDRLPTLVEKKLIIIKNLKYLMKDFD